LRVLLVYNTAEYLLRFRKELIWSLQQTGATVHALTPRDSHVPALQDLGVVWHEWKLKGHSTNPVRELMSVVDACLKIRQIAPDAICNFTIKPLIYASIAAKLFSRARIVSMITGMGALFAANSPKGRLLRWLVLPVYKLAGRLNDHIVFQNADDRQDFLDWGICDVSKAVLTKGSGVDLQRFAYVPPPAFSGRFILIARLLKDKGIEQFVRAAAQVRAVFPDARFEIAGPLIHGEGGVSQKDLDAWVRQGLVAYLGELPDVRPAIASADVYVLPTYYPEGIPRTILEAMALGRSVVTTDWRGCREAVVHGESGWLVQPMSSESLSQALFRFLEDPSLASRMGLQARARAEQEFDVQVVTQRIAALLTAS
jgi:glycosyltransferase involved in cell wall biosynthesis